ncbi:fluoride efflux transporter CrcB [Hathewaya limosa]|uniref:Fluoride-specific ion channel FluC n=1 Tax=Hathewaya limosa TaxID=1536 RepID=A0ABU0JTV0_HATLI|nr:fluoride efflux transporter CrcB [Hathewaya limosa]MDQ0480532.1 CrcB protein [Hathewaya limosa]
MQKLFYVGIGGFLGALIRYLISNTSTKLLGTKLPYGTLIVNILGGFLIGLIMGLSMNKNLISPNLKLFLTTGVMGGLTTFSTFSYETVTLFNNGSYILGVINISLNLFLSLIGVVLGQFISHLLL